MNQQVIADVRKWRLEAQSQRREARTAPAAEARQQSLEQAVAGLTRAISALKRELRAVKDQPGAQEDRAKLRELLSQTLGSLGGTYRDGKDYPAAIRYYDEGNEVEDLRRKEDGALDTYNLVQRLVVRLLDSSGKMTDEVRQDLRSAQDELGRQNKRGRRDPWWLADTAVVRVLLNED